MPFTSGRNHVIFGNGIENAACLPYLERQTALVNPFIIVSLGATALRGLLGESPKITRERRNWQLMPTYHPSALLRNPNLKERCLGRFQSRDQEIQGDH